MTTEQAIRIAADHAALGDRGTSTSRALAALAAEIRRLQDPCRRSAIEADARRLDWLIKTRGRTGTLPGAPVTATASLSFLIRGTDTDIRGAIDRAMGGKV